MADVTSQWTSSADEIIAQLDALHQKSAATRAANRHELAVLVDGLGYGTAAESDSPQERRPEAEAPRPRYAEEAPAGEPFVALPRITRPGGGGWGPMVREKLTRIALSKRASRW